MAVCGALTRGAGRGAGAVLGSWVGVRRLFRHSLFLTASRMVLPKILVLMLGGRGARSEQRERRVGTSTSEEPRGSSSRYTAAPPTPVASPAGVEQRGSGRGDCFPFLGVSLSHLGGCGIREGGGHSLLMSEGKKGIPLWD